MLDPTSEERGSIVAELRRLRSKLAEVSDKDIKAALGQRIEALDRRLAELKLANPVEGEADFGSGASEAAKADLEAELKRLKVKHGAVGDADMQAALGVRIDEIKAQLAAMEAESGPPVAEELPPPPTGDEKDAADKLVQQARVEKMRNNPTGVANLLREASRIAPGSAEVLELLADELASQGKNEDAIATYDKARKLDAKNVNVDRKHAELVFRAKAAGATAHMSMADQQAMASTGGRAALFSLLLPGLGQIVLGQTMKGSVMMGTWGTCMLWLLLGHKQLEGFLHYTGSLTGLHPGGTTDFSFAILIPLVVALIVHVTSIASCKASSREAQFFASTGGGKAQHPKPPVDLPFE